MATKRKNKQGHWVISIQSLGLNTTLSTKTTKISDANRIERQLESRIDTVKLDGSHAYHNWSKADQLKWIKSGLEPKPVFDEAITVEKAIDDYLLFIRSRDRAFSTANGYEDHLKSAKSRFGLMLLRDLSTRKLQDWITDLSSSVIGTGANRGKVMSIRTQRKKVDALKRVVRHFQSLGEIGANDRVFDALSYGISGSDVLDGLTPWDDFEGRLDDLKRLGIAETTEGAFNEIILTSSQQQEQLAYLQTKLYNDGTVATIRLFACIYFCCCTGARRSELTRVRRQDLRLDDTLPTVTILKRKGRGSKNLLRQKTVLNAKLVPVLRRLLALLPSDQQCIFTADDTHFSGGDFDQEQERSKADYLGKQLIQALAGSKWEHSAGWHIYRHTLASLMLSAGYSKTEVKEVIGWCSDEMALRYQHLRTDRKAAIINDLI